MMPGPEIDQNEPVLVEFTPRQGVEQVALIDWLKRPREECEKKSAEALDSAMKTIRGMAQRVSALKEAIPAEFSQAEVQFGIKLDFEAGAFLAKAGLESSINVKLTWERKKQQDGQ